MTSLARISRQVPWTTCPAALGTGLLWPVRAEVMLSKNRLTRHFPRGHRTRTQIERALTPAGIEMGASAANKQDDSRRQREGEDKAAQEWSVHAISNE